MKLTSLDISEQSFQLAEQVDELREAAQTHSGQLRTMLVEAIREARQALDEAAIIAGNWTAAEPDQAAMVLNEIQHYYGHEDLDVRAEECANALVLCSEVDPAHLRVDDLGGCDWLLRMDEHQEKEDCIFVVRRFLK